MFVPIAIETGGAWDQEAIEFIQELGKRISVVPQEPKDMQHLFQQLFMAIQRGNAVTFLKSFTLE